MTGPEQLTVDDALDRLVNQFSDSMAFLRELIQNAIDAGSDEVEVWFERSDGRMVVHVDDWGSGMNREIIETGLTRLFSSSKDGDRTKIGKFGIGFVSVFAIEPEAVCLDTSRDGEHWRVLFDSDRKFSLIRRETPVEGTKLAIYKRVSASEYEQFKARTREVVEYWCKHVQAEIRVDGEVINQALDLDHPIKIRRERDDERIVVAHPLDGGAFAGFYNRGLTLIEELAGSGAQSSAIPGVAFKLSSPLLAHTLTRDDVVREGAFVRLLAEIRELVATELCVALFAKLDEDIRALVPSQPLENQARAWLEYLWAAAGQHEGRKHAIPSTAALFRSPSGACFTREQLRKPKQRQVIVATRPSPIAATLERSGATVVWLPEACSRGRALLERLAPAVVEIDRFCTALPPRDADEAARWRVLELAVERLLSSWGAKLRAVELGHLAYDDSSVAERVAITQAEFGEPTSLDAIDELGSGLFASRRRVVLNADHPTIRSIAALAQTEPELAAYFAVKAFFLGTKLDSQTDEQLLTLTHSSRAARIDP